MSEAPVPAAEGSAAPEAGVPAAAGVGTMARIAVRRLVADAGGWLPIVLVVGVANAAIWAVVANPSAAFVDAANVIAGADASSGTTAFLQAGETWQLSALALTPFTTLASWLFGAYAIEALLGRPATLFGALRSGARALVVSMAFAAFVLFLATIETTLALLGPLGDPLVRLVFELAWLLVVAIVGLRLLLVAPAVFDGARAVDAVLRSWRLTRRGLGGFVLRWLPGAIAGGGIGLVGAIAGLAIGASSDLAGGFVGGVSAALSGLVTTFWLTTLYAGQLSREEPADPGASPPD